MKISATHSTLRLAVRTALCAAMVATTALAAGVAASPVAGAASTAPPWESTGANYGSVGGLQFFDASGNPVTGGNLTDAPIAAYVEGTSTVRAGDTKATLYAYTPVNGVAPGNWTGQALSASTTYPNASAPAPLNTSTLPVVTGAAGDESLSEYIAQYPNNDSSSDGYADLYQLRLKTTASGQAGNTTYDSADILVTGTTWSLVFPTTVTTTTLTTTPVSPVSVGSSVELDATVTPSGATGSVQFRYGTSNIGSPVTVSGGTASTTTSSLPAGTDPLYAVFTPDATSGGNGDSASSGTTPLVVQTPTTTALTTTPAGSADYGASVQLNATVTPSAATGTVQFENGTTPIGSPVAVSGGTASTTTSSLPAGDLTLNAVFTGTGGYATSTGTTSFTVDGIATTTSLTTTPVGSADFGASVQLNATVTPSAATGTVQFENGTTPIGSPVAVSGGTASTTTTSLPVGSLTLNAVFTATGNYAGSTGTTSFTVDGTPTTTVLTTDPSSPVTSGTSVQLNATITPSAATGTVQFENGTTPIGSPVAVSGGTASTTTSTLPVGSLTLNAVFTGTGDYASSSDGIPFTVNGTPTTTVLTTTPVSPVDYGTSVQLNATITPSAATGTVQFENGTTPIGSPVAVSGGTASTTTTSLPVGSLTLHAVFTPTGGNGYAASTGTDPFTVDPVPTTTVLTTNPTPSSDYGTSVQLNATITPSAATGTVQFENGTTPIGSPVAVSGGTASTTTTSLPVGSLTLNAVFTATGNYAGSTGTTSFTVVPEPTSTVLTTTPASPQFAGTSVQLKATVTPSAATGTVQFENGTTAIGSPVAVSGGSATLTTSTLPAGTLTLHAVFTATGDYAGSTGTATFVVNPLTATTTALTTTPASPQFAGTSVQLEATVTPSAATGTVQFENGTTPIGGPVAVSAGSAATTTSGLPAGSLTLNAVFTPAAGSGYSGSTGSTPFTVTPLTPTSTSLTASPTSPQQVGTSVTFTATVSPSAATGTVQFRNGTSDLGRPVTVTDGTASITTTLPAGDATVTAVFTPTSGSGYASSSGSVEFESTGITGKGYWLVASDGGVFAFGDATFYGSTGGTVLNKPIVGIATTPDGKGYWLVASDGGVFAFGDATFCGSTGGTVLNKPIVGIATTPDGKGYWLVASDGGVFAFGDATFYGSTGGTVLNKPIVGIATTPDGKGYWLVASDGGVFAFGDATFYGSTGGTVLNKPIVGIATTPDGKGYWLVASDGGVFAFGDATFYGSTGGTVLNKPIVGIATTPDGKGYWLVASDGGVFAFGDATFYGSTGGTVLNKPVVGLAGA